MADDLGMGAMVCGLLAIFVPWNRVAARVAAGAAGFLTAAGTVMFLLRLATPGGSEIPIDLIIDPPLLLFAWLRCLNLMLRALRETGS